MLFNKKFEVVEIRDNGVTITHFLNGKRSDVNKDIEMFDKQYGNLIIKYTDKVHDRYIIIDNKKLYHLGASIKDLGKKIFSISESPNEIIDELLIRI